jgi:hypothetical protein
MSLYSHVEQYCGRDSLLCQTVLKTQLGALYAARIEEVVKIE